MEHINSKVTIGMLKAMPRKWDVEGNWAIFQEQFRKHQGDGIDIFITPECFLDGYAATEKDWTAQRFAEVAQDLGNSEYIQRIRDMALQTRVNIVLTTGTLWRAV